jgi:hypothetical protein
MIRKATYEELEMILATQVQAFSIYTNAENQGNGAQRSDDF